MKKLAIFVEGHTEQYFINKLLIEIAGKKNIVIQVLQGSGGKKTPRKFTRVKCHDKITDQKYFVLIYNSCTDSRVNSDIKDSIEKLAKEGFEKVIGLKDVFPKTTQEEIHKAKLLRNYGIPTKFIPCEVVLAIMEIETWYIAEHNHYRNIDESLTLDIIKESLIDLENIDVTSIVHPAATLHDIYQLVGKRYDKSRDVVQDTVKALDYEEIYCNLKTKIDSLSSLLTHIDDFLSA